MSDESYSVQDGSVVVTQMQPVQTASYTADQITEQLATIQRNIDQFTVDQAASLKALNDSKTYFLGLQALLPPA